MKGTLIVWSAGAMIAGVAAVVAARFVQSRPPPALLGALQRTHWGADLAHSWVSATAAPAHRRGRPLQRGDVVPDLALPDLHGRVRHLSEWRGKRVLLNFWASWCRPCRREMPALDAAQARYGGSGVQIIGIALNDPARVRAFLDEAPVRYPVLLGAQAASSPARAFGDSLGALPFSVLIDAHGRVVATRYGALQTRQLRWWLD